jgi:twinkle protein
VTVAEWIEGVKVTPLASIAPTLGMRVGRMHTWGPCPACNETTRGKDDRRGPVGVSGDGKGWKCHRCSAHGDVLDLIALIKYGRKTSEFNGAQWAELRTFCSEQGWCSATGDRPSIRTSEDMAARLLGKQINEERKRSKPDPEPEASEQHEHRDGGGGAFAWREGLAEECAARLFTPEGKAVLDYLTSATGRGFTEATVKEWGLGAAVIAGEPWLTIPLRDHSERVVNVRFRSVPPAKKSYRVCNGRPLPLFGVDRLGTDIGSAVIVTEGELDVVALWQYGFTASVVSGTAGAGAWKDEWLDVLEPYTGFTLCYDNDKAGNEGAIKFAEKMGVDRCTRAVLPKKDANECLVSGVPVESIRRALVLATPMFGSALKTVDQYADDLEKLISNPQELVGRSTSSQRLDAAIGGLRPGLVIVSGDTGHGKTTFATWLCYAQAKAGVPTMITSFEQRPIGSVQKLVRMELGGDFTSVSPDQRRDAVLALGKLPLTILDHYGDCKPDRLMNAIRYGARRLGVRVVLVDHLGFLLERGEDERQQIEAIVRALAITAYTVGVTIVLVCHPKSLPQDADRPTLNDLKGASAIKQDASEVLIVVRDPPRPNAKPPRPWPGTWVYVDKVRSEFGVADSKVLLAFGPLSCCYADDWSKVPEGRTGQLIAIP